MPKIGFEKLSKDDLNSVKISVYKLDGRVSSLWGWLTKKDKQVDLKHKALIKNDLKLNLTADDLKKLKSSGIDIQQIQSHNNKSNKERLSHSNQACVLPKGKCLKEGVMFNNCTTLTSDKKSKKVKNSKSGTKSMVSVNINSVNQKHLKDGFGKNSQHISGEKSPVNRIKINNKQPHKDVELESVSQKKSQITYPQKKSQITIQRRTLIPVCLGWQIPCKFRELHNIRVDELNNQHGELKEKEAIPMLISKIKSMEAQISDIESKTKKLNEAVSSKQNVLKSSPAQYDLHMKNSSPETVTKNAVSHKVYSKHFHFSKPLKKCELKKGKKKNNYSIYSSSVIRSKNNKVKNNGYPFDNFKDALNNTSITYNEPKEPKNDGANYFEKFCSLKSQTNPVMNKMTFGDKNMTMDPDMILKLFCTFSEINNIITDQQMAKTPEHQESHKVEGDSLSEYNLMSKPTFNWKHKSLFTSSNTKAEQMVRTLEQDIDPNKNVAAEHSVIKHIGNDKLYWNVQEGKSHTVLSVAPQVCIGCTTPKQDTGPVTQSKVLENTAMNEVTTVIGMDPKPDKVRISHEDPISVPCKSNSLTIFNMTDIDGSLNINELNNETVTQSHAYADTLNKITCPSELLPEELVPSDYKLNKSDIQIDLKPNLKNVCSQISKESEEQILFRNITPNEKSSIHHCNIYSPNNRILESEHSCCEHVDDTTAYDSVSCKGLENNDKRKSLNKNIIKDISIPLPQEVKEPKLKVTILVEDNLDRKINLKRDYTKFPREFKYYDGCCKINPQTLQKNKYFQEKSSDDRSHCYTNSCYSLDKVNIKSTTSKDSLGLKNHRNIKKNYSVNARKFESNQMPNNFKTSNYLYTEENHLQFKNDRKYLYKKERKLYKKPYLGNFIDPLSEINININKKDDTLETNKHTTFDKSKSNMIMAEGDCNYEHRKIGERLNNNRRNQFKGNATTTYNNDKLIKYIHNKPSILENEIDQLSAIKEQKDLGNNHLQEKQEFFRILDNDDTERDKIGKCISVGSKKKSFRYGLTLSQEPILEESEDGKSAKSIIYNERQTEKGDNFEIKTIKCVFDNSTETFSPTKDSVSKLSVCWNRNSINDQIPVEYIDTYSVFVQTDLSLIGNALNKCPTKTNSSQTEIVMDQMTLFDKETPNRDLCSLMPDQIEEGKLISSDDVGTKKKCLGIKIQKENITEVKLSDLVISVVRDGAGDASPNDTSPKHIITVTYNRINDDAMNENVQIPCEKYIESDTLLNHQNDFFSDNRKFEPIHKCTARCFYSQSQESGDLAYKSKCLSETSPVDQNVSSDFSKSPKIGFFKYESENNTVQNVIDSNKESTTDHFCEENTEKSTLLAPLKNSDNINEEYLNKVCSKQSYLITMGNQKSTVTEINSSTETDEIKSSNEYIAT